MIQKAKEISDCIIFVAHWGTEDETMPNEYEKQWAAFLMQQGVDVIIGGHPHVLQPYGQLSDDQGHNTTIFYSLGNFVSTQQELPELLEGMASFTIQKSTLNGKSTIQILSPEVKPMVMHYNHDNGEYGPYMLDDYTEELASSHSVRNVIGDEFTLDNLKAKFKEIMSMNVKPSTNTNLLNVKFDWEGNMIDKTTGNVVDLCPLLIAFTIPQGTYLIRLNSQQFLCILSGYINDLFCCNSLQFCDCLCYIRQI